MAIEYFKRPFTDEERAKLEQQISRLEESEEKNLVDVLEPMLLLLEEFLTATPQVFDKAHRGNLFSSPGR